MNNNPYDTSVEWTNFHSQSTEDVRHYGGAYSYPLTPSYQQEKIKPRSTPKVKRLSKSEALEMASALKGYIVIATLLGFGTLGGLVANQIFTTNTAINQSQPQAAPSMQAPSYPSGPSNSGGFFNRHGQGGYGSGQGQGGYGSGQGQGGGYGFGQGNNSSPYSGSHTS